MPKRSSAQSVGVEGVHAVMLSRDIDNVVETLPGDAHTGHIEWRGKRNPVQRIREKLSKLSLVYVCGSQDRLIVILTRSQVIVVIRERARIVADIYGRVCRRLLVGRRRHGVSAYAARGRV